MNWLEYFTIHAIVRLLLGSYKNKFLRSLKDQRKDNDRET